GSARLHVGKPCTFENLAELGQRILLAERTDQHEQAERGGVPWPGAVVVHQDFREEDPPARGLRIEPLLSELPVSLQRRFVEHVGKEEGVGVCTTFITDHIDY